MICEQCEEEIEPSEVCEILDYWGKVDSTICNNCNENNYDAFIGDYY